MVTELYNPKGLAENRAMSAVQYNSVAHAVAELIDNSIEAGADTVVVFLTDTTGGIEIGVLDNGRGMEPELLEKSLGQGNTAKKGTTRIIGKFGVGLKSSGLWLGDRLEVTSWNKQNAPHRSYLDREEIAAGYMKHVPTPMVVTFPLADKPINTITKTKLHVREFYTSGTYIKISKATKMPKSTKRLFDHLEEELGRLFRYYISDGLRIYIKDNSNFISKKIDLIDPCMTLVESGKHLNKYVTPTSKEYNLLLPVLKGEDTLFEMIENGYDEIEYIDDELRRPVKGNIRYKTTRIKEKYYRGLLDIDRRPGKLDVGKALESLSYIYFTRSKREIQKGSFRIYRVANNPQHRWWGLEIMFEPELDNLLRVSNNKQGISFAQATAPETLSHGNFFNYVKNEIFERFIKPAVKENKRIATEVERTKTHVNSVDKGKVSKSAIAANITYGKSNTLSKMSVVKENKSQNYVLDDGRKFNEKLTCDEAKFPSTSKNKFLGYEIQDGVFRVQLNIDSLYMTRFYNDLSPEDKEYFKMLIYSLFKGVDEMIEDFDVNKKLINKINENIFNMLMEYEK